MYVTAVQRFPNLFTVYPAFWHLQTPYRPSKYNSVLYSLGPYPHSNHKTRLGSHHRVGDPLWLARPEIVL